MEFRNVSKGTRNGFCHITELYLEGELLTTVKCSYLNRTWESYPFQSSMKQAVNKAIESEISAEKTERKIKRLTKELKDDIVNSSTIIQKLKEKYKTL